MNKKKPQTSVELKSGSTVSVGDLIRYYREGWRVGHLESIKGATSKVRPIASKYAATPRLVNVPVDDLTEL